MLEREREEDKLRSSQWRWLHINKNNLGFIQLLQLEEKTKSMVKMIEQDAELFSQRAEIYYNKRRKLINMVQDFNRMHTSLVESYDQLIKFECGSHLLTSCLRLTKNGLRKLMSLQLQSYCKLDEPEVDDPEEEEKVAIELSDSGKEEWRGELERLREENKVQREELVHKDEEKRDVIRQLSLAMDLELEKCLQTIFYKLEIEIIYH